MATQQPAQPQVIVVQQAAPAAVVEPEMNCCGCIEVKCGITTLMVLEIFYLIGFIVIMATVVLAAAFVGAVSSAADSSAQMQTSFNSQGGSFNTQGGSFNTQASKEVADSAGDLATAMLLVGIGCIIAEIPRLYYLCKLCGFVCCGGKVRDTK